LEKTEHGVTEMILNYVDGCNLKEFFLENKQQFEDQVLNYAVNSKGKSKKFSWLAE
jgi:hypothetical protein